MANNISVAVGESETIRVGAPAGRVVDEAGRGAGCAPIAGLELPHADSASIATSVRPVVRRITGSSCRRGMDSPDRRPAATSSPSSRAVFVTDRQATWLAATARSGDDITVAGQL